MELWELTAREAIRHTVASYAHCADRGRFDELALLFATDGMLEVHGEPPHAGRNAIRSFLGAVKVDLVATPNPHIRHNVTNLLIDIASPTEATGSSYFMVVTEAGLDHWGRYRDRYVPDGDRWLFAHRYVRTDGMVPDGFAARRNA